MYTFSADLLTGNQTIDAQHKELFKAINDLISACMKFKAGEEVNKTLDFLVSYTAKHFADEENLQMKSKYPAFGTHKILHDNFKKEVSRLAQDAKNSPTDTNLISKVTKTAGDWLLTHIKIEDLKVARHIAANK